MVGGGAGVHSPSPLLDPDRSVEAPEGAALVALQTDARSRCVALTQGLS